MAQRIATLEGKHLAEMMTMPEAQESRALMVMVLTTMEVPYSHMDRLYDLHKVNRTHVREWSLGLALYRTDRKVFRTRYAMVLSALKND